MSTAHIIVIGNELLSGKMQDTNSPWLARRCRTLGIDLRRICVIPDQIELIGDTVREASGAADLVFTSGGIGPTHDDITYAGVARAFDVGLRREPSVEAAIREKLADRWTSAAARMALLPEGAELWWDGDIPIPLVVMRNVWIFPGVPGLLRRRFDLVASRLAHGSPIQGRRLVFIHDEVAIADTLSGAQERWPGVEIGSYPQFQHRPWTVTVTLDSRDEAALGACEAWLRTALASCLAPAGTPTAMALNAQAVERG